MHEEFAFVLRKLICHFHRYQGAVFEPETVSTSIFQTYFLRSIFEGKFVKVNFWRSIFQGQFFKINFSRSIFQGQFFKAIFSWSIFFQGEFFMVNFWRSIFQSYFLKVNFSCSILKVNFWRSIFEGQFLKVNFSSSIFQVNFWRSIFQSYFMKVNFSSSIFEGHFSKVNFWRLNFEGHFLKINFSLSIFPGQFFQVNFRRSIFQGQTLQGQILRIRFRVIFSRTCLRCKIFSFRICSLIFLFIKRLSLSCSSSTHGKHGSAHSGTSCEHILTTVFHIFQNIFFHDFGSLLAVFIFCFSDSQFEKVACFLWIWMTPYCIIHSPWKKGNIFSIYLIKKKKQKKIKWN